MWKLFLLHCRWYHVVCVCVYKDFFTKNERIRKHKYESYVSSIKIQIWSISFIFIVRLSHRTVKSREKRKRVWKRRFLRVWEEIYGPIPSLQYGWKFFLSIMVASKKGTIKSIWELKLRYLSCFTSKKWSNSKLLFFIQLFMIQKFKRHHRFYHCQPY